MMGMKMMNNGHDGQSSPGGNRQQQRGLGEIVTVTMTVTKALEVTMKGLNE